MAATEAAGELHIWTGEG